MLTITCISCPVYNVEYIFFREKPHDEEWNELNTRKLPLLLNYSQCQLIQGEYYSAVTHCSTVLESDADNVKALYRRGKAYVSLCEGAKARKDLNK